MRGTGQYFSMVRDHRLLLFYCLTVTHERCLGFQYILKVLVAQQFDVLAKYNEVDRMICCGKPSFYSDDETLYAVVMSRLAELYSGG